jgi:adenylate cyclase
MEKGQLSRKLAVILHADVVGSTSLVQKNETLAHERIQSVFHQFSKTIKSYGGITRELRGDALVAEFERASDAVPAALAFQVSNEDFNSRLEDDIQPQLRIGISLGEVVVADNTLTGAGVVLAQRLEQLAESGGVVVQGSVSETVPTRMPFDFESLGEQMLKGFEQPVRAFSVSLLPGELLPAPEVEISSDTEEPNDTLVSGKLSPNTYEALTGERLELPDIPSIAVLPFQNMSGDPEQEHFADGMSEDIITVLSRIPDLIVIARNSTFVYKGRAVDVREVGKNLGVGYVLEGSIRKSGERLRITAQLVDTQNGDHIWAERYDRNLDDIFAIQDEITREISVALSVQLTYGDEMRVWSERSSNFEIWELFQRGMTENMKFTPEGNARALQIARQVRQLDPDYYMSKVFLGYVLQIGARYGFIADADAAISEAELLAREVLTEDEQSGDAHALLGFILTNRSKHDEGIAHGKRAIELGPSVATNHAILALSLFYASEHAASLARMKIAIRLSPFPQDWFLVFLGDNYRSLGDLEKARLVFEHLGKRLPGSIVSLTRLACIYTDLGESDRARQAVDVLLSTNPDFSVRKYAERMPFKLSADRESLVGGLLNAGLSE